MNPIEPDHYLNADGQDLFEQWWNKYPVVVFIAIMDCIEERYRFRADRKNGEQDIKKADEVRKRKNEYVEAYLKQIEYTPQLPENENYFPMPLPKE